jgi:hypothetical protein
VASKVLERTSLYDKKSTTLLIEKRRVREEALRNDSSINKVWSCPLALINKVGAFGMWKDL